MDIPLLDVIAGQMRVRVMETVYRAELRHHEDPADYSEKKDKEHIIGEKFSVSTDWLCAWLGAEHLCVNVSRRLGDRGTGEVNARLSHSFSSLNATGNHHLNASYYFLHSRVHQCLCLLAAGLPDSNSAEVRYSQDGSRLSLLAELQAGTEPLKAQFNAGQTEQAVPRWEYCFQLQHQVQALLKRGVTSSIEAKTHYQVQDCHLCFHLWKEYEHMLIFYAFILPVSSRQRD